MNKYHFLSLICFIAGIICFAMGVSSGDVETGIVVVFPFLAGSGLFAFLGFILFFVAIILFIFGFTRNVEYQKLIDEDDQPVQKKTSVKGGGVVLIGPIPIVFGSNWKIAAILMVLAIVIIIIISFFMLRIY